ncbi:MAG TPA: helix-turn-helix transcriptional regulator [Candidatus Levybacteria bacterium]|nr:helix-turn-helix transcriptional regulator [Candidatus Levybacteria bacterium]
MTDRQKITKKEQALGKAIARARNNKNMTQEELAVKTHLTQTFISLLETGQRKASMKTLEKIANVLKIKVNEIIPF